jgi:hypothetical protein
MIPELDIWRAANLLIRKHGANADLEAAKRADLMLDRGDDDGRLLWSRIRRAIETLPALRRDRLNASDGVLAPLVIRTDGSARASVRNNTGN